MFSDHLNKHIILNEYVTFIKSLHHIYVNIVMIIAYRLANPVCRKIINGNSVNEIVSYLSHWFQPLLSVFTFAVCLIGMNQTMLQIEFYLHIELQGIETVRRDWDQIYSKQSVWLAYRDCSALAGS